MADTNRYELVVGLEVHAQLLTQSKLFCGDSIAYGAPPNTQVSPVTLAHPGTLPRMNRKAIEYAIKMGLACHCRIEKQNYFARKNYFYPDLPKGYQVSQHTTPICQGGYVSVQSGDQTRQIRLNRIHMEEDAGKSLHELDPAYSCIDFNRAGTPLIEIVSEPDIRSSDEAYQYLTELRKLVRYLDICDGNMEEGSFRCDANISVRPVGASKLGTRVEVKNLNSIRNVKRAIDFEAARLMKILDRGEVVIQQTRSFDANNGTTFAIRDKEDADDYRYFADPDLPPFSLSDAFIEDIRQTIPALQEDRVRRYTSEWSLPAYDARVLTDDRETAEFFETLAAATTNYKAAANWMLGPVKSWMNEQNKPISEFPLTAATLAKAIAMVDSGKLSFGSATGKLFQQLLEEPDMDPESLADRENLIQQSDADSLEPLIDEILSKHAEKVKEYKKGKKGLLSLFVGEVMKRSRGKADPRVTNEILLEKLRS